MGLWAKSIVIFNAIRAYGKQSIRSLADRTGLSKSSVHRHLQAMDRRDRSPESSLWETEAGRAWLIRLLVATLFVFGLKRGVGAETLSEFFRRLRLEAHVGVLTQRSATRHAHVGRSPARDGRGVGEGRYCPWRDTPGHRGRGRDLSPENDAGVHGPGQGLCAGHHWQEVGRAWRQHLSNVSGILHPWRLVDSIRQTSKEVEEQLRAELKAIERLLETNGLP